MDSGLLSVPSGYLRQLCMSLTASVVADPARIAIEVRADAGMVSSTVAMNVGLITIAPPSCARPVRRRCLRLSGWHLPRLWTRPDRRSDPGRRSPRAMTPAPCSLPGAQMVPHFLIGTFRFWIDPGRQCTVRSRMARTARKGAGLRRGPNVPPGPSPLQRREPGQNWRIA